MSGNRWVLPPHLIDPAFIAMDAALALPWHITQYGIESKIWPIANGRDIKLGIVDTGVSAFQANQGDLAGAIFQARDFSGSRFGYEDHNGHGTHVAGIAGSRTFGVAPGCQLIIAKALGDDGSGSDASVANAIDFCIKQGANVINLSLGSESDSQAIIGRIVEFEQQGGLVVAASGNSGGPPNSPGRNSHTICDAAIDQNGIVAPFSCHGKEVDVCGPGVNIRSLGLGASLVLMSGTSMSSPWISGMIVNFLSWQKSRKVPLLKGVNPAIEWLTRASDDLGNPGTDEFYGVGLPDADKMFKDDGTPIGLPQPLPSQQPKPKSVIVTMDNGTVVTFEK